MTKKGKDIVEELEQITPGFNLPPAPPPYKVPAGYFDALPEQVLQNIRKQDAADQAQEELEALSPLLATAPRQQPLSVPDGYFDDLSSRIMTSVAAQAEKAPARVVPIKSRRRYLSWAVAACLLAGIGLSALFLLRQNTVSSNMEAQLAGVSDQEIVDYLQARSDAFDNDAIFSNVSNVETAEELPKMPNSLSDLPAEAIEKYLENTGYSN
jgi:hypothetical protein